MRRLLVCCAIALLWSLGNPSMAAAAAPKEMPAAVRACQAGYAGYGFTNVGGCVSFVARGGTLTTVAPSLTLTFNSAPCYNFPSLQCMWSVEVAGLAPGSEVIVGEAAVLYGAPLLVGAGGTISVQGIYMMGSCITSGYENPTFITRGEAPDGTTVESTTVTADLTTYLSALSSQESWPSDPTLPVSRSVFESSTHAAGVYVQAPCR